MYWMAGPCCTEYRGSGVKPTMTYVGYVARRYGHVIIVFDVYQEELYTKYGAHERRTGGRAGPTVDFTRDMTMKLKKEDFLSNKDNNQRFVRMLGKSLEHAGCETRHAKGDADVDVLIVGGQESQRPRRVPWKLRSSRQITSTANLPYPSPEHASCSRRATSVVIRRGLVLLQLNAEGISKANIQVIEHLATKNLATVILLQETHVTNPDVLNIPGYSLAAYTSSRVHGVATFV